MRRQNLQTISWFNDIFNRKLLNIEPPYQRRSVWNQAYRDYFIDTILLGYPAPAIFLYEEISDSGVSQYHVVDGKQRLITIFEFAKGSFSVSEKTLRIDLRGKYFDELPPDVKNVFWGYTFLIEYLSTTEESVLNNIFDRINRNVAKLTSQELRHAKYSGVFISSAEDSNQSLIENLAPNFPRIGYQSRKEMKDIEFVSQLLLLTEEGPRGYSVDELNEAFDNRDTEWEEQKDVIRNFKECTNILDSILKGDNENQIVKSRFRNQADFYSLFGVIVDLQKSKTLPTTEKLIEVLKKFLSLVDNEKDRSKNTDINQYYEYARTASNRTTARKERVRILKKFIFKNLKTTK